MEKIRNAMAKEKEKARNHALKMNQKREKSQMESRKAESTNYNPMKLEKNLEGFSQ